MSRIKIYIALIFCSVAQIAGAQQIAVKTDVLFDGLATPNLGLELVTGNKTTLGISAMGCSQPYGKDINFLAVQPEFRYWFNGRPMTREFVGLGAIVASYRLQWKNEFYRGFAGGIGLTFGYTYNISKRFNVEGYFGFGAVAYRHFDHESETPGLGAKIKDEAWFREKFIGKTVEWGDTPAFRLEKNAEASGAANAVDAITGATMTSKGLNEALNVWFKAYENHFGLGAFFNALEEHAIETTTNAEEE